ELDPKNAERHSNLGGVLLEKGRLDEAIASCRKAIDLDPKYTPAHNNLCLALQRKGLLNEAVAAYKEAIRIKPSDAGAHNHCAWLLASAPDAKLRNPGEAVKLAQKAVELAPKVGTYWNTLGVAHYRAGDWKNAFVALEKSMDLCKGGDAF